MDAKKLMLISVNADPLGVKGLKYQGGQNKRILELCKNLTIKGWSIDVYTSHYEETINVSSVNPCFRVIRISTGKIRAYDDYYFDELEIRTFYKNTLKFLQQEQLEYDNLFCFYWLSGIVGDMLKKDLNLNFGISFCSLGIYKQEPITAEIEYRLKREEEVARKASYVVTQSHHEKEIMIEKFNVHPNVIEIIPGGIDERIFYPKKKKILFVGRPVKQKGLSDLLDALIMIQNDDWELGIIGKTFEQVLSNSKYNCLSEKIQLFGSIDNTEVANVMREYDILVVPSHYENFGNVALEGMASGMLVIVSDVNGLGELVTHGVTGLHFSSKSPKSLANQLKIAIADDLMNIRKNAIQFSKTLRWKNLTLKYEEIFAKNTIS